MQLVSRFSNRIAHFVGNAIVVLSTEYTPRRAREIKRNFGVLVFLHTVPGGFTGDKNFFLSGIKRIILLPYVENAIWEDSTPWFYYGMQEQAIHAR